MEEDDEQYQYSDDEWQGSEARFAPGRSDVGPKRAFLGERGEEETGRAVGCAQPIDRSIAGRGDGGRGVRRDVRHAMV